MKEKLLVIGNGMAPGRMLEHLLDIDPDRFDITVFNAEPRVNYNRLMLSHVLSCEKTYEDIITHDEPWHEEHGVKLLMGTPVATIDTVKQSVTTKAGDTFDYDKLVIATGSNPIMIPLPGHQLPGVKVYRDLDDVDYMTKVAQGSGRVVVIGGGLLGLEAAAGLKERGMDVCVVHLTEHLMDKQLDSSASFLLQKEFERRGIEVRTSTSTTEILGDSHVTGVRFANGDETACEMLVMAVGIRPSSIIARQAGMEVNHGIVVDDAMRTSAPNVFALGECVEHQGKCHVLVAPLYDMAKVLANSLTDQQACFTSSATATKLKVNGVDLYSAGEFLDGGEATGIEDIVLRDAAAGIYKRVILEGKRIVGIVLYGDTEDGGWYFDMLKKQTDISEMRETLVFGQAFQGGAALDPTAAVAALPDDAEICGCNGTSLISPAVKMTGGQRIDHSGTTITWFRTSTDEVFALEDQWLHSNGPLSQGIVQDDCVTCPLHNWVISLRDGSVQGVDEGQTRRFPVRLDVQRLQSGLGTE